MAVAPGCRGPVAVIPARGGSKRVPRKNLADVCGRPMLAYPVETCRKSGLFDAVIVSTDDEEIAAAAEAARRHSRLAARRTRD